MRPIMFSNRIEAIINEEFNMFINEIFDKEISTEYTELHTKIDIFDATVYRFQTNSNTSYDLEFIYNYVLGRDKLEDGSKLYQHINNLKPNETYDSVDIAFTLTERVKDNNDIDDIIYGAESKKNEPIELMGRIQYLIKEFIKTNNNINVFVIGKNTKSGKLSMYMKLFDNIFSTNFNTIEGNHHGYMEGAIYFINKNVNN